MDFISLVAGFALGILKPSWVPLIAPFRNLFIHGVKSNRRSADFCNFGAGYCGSGSFKQVGKMGIRAFIYFDAATIVALGVGLFIVNLLKPGPGVKCWLRSA
jgi:Na+/H+-dicarboxylate symporter